MIVNNERIKISTKLATSAFNNPEAITALICIIVDEVSLSDLNRIQARYFEQLKYLENKSNIKN